MIQCSPTHLVLCDQCFKLSDVLGEWLSVTVH